MKYLFMLLIAVCSLNIQANQSLTQFYTQSIFTFGYDFNLADIDLGLDEVKTFR